MNRKSRNIILPLLILFVYFFAGIRPMLAQDVTNLARKARQFFDRKEYNRAVALWLNILEIDPENERAKQSIEMAYEVKQRKDLAYHRAKLRSRVARKKLKQDDDPEIRDGISIGKNSIKNFITAYRIDPKDPEMKRALEEMKRLDEEIKAAEEKLRLSRAKREKIKRLKIEAAIEMKQTTPRYKKALDLWEEVLDLASEDKEALEGRRKCRLAIQNRLKFEQIQKFMTKGRGLFEEKQYKSAKLQFAQVMQIDPKNRDARDFIDKIDELIEDAAMKTRRLQQAEDFYQSGITNIRYNNFDRAEDDFESTLALIKNYKDAKKRLASIDRLRKEYNKKKKAEKLRRINQTFQDGIIAFSGGKYKQAIAAFVATLSLDRENTQARDYLKRARDAQRLTEEEIVDENSPYYDIIHGLTIAGKSLYNKKEYQKSKDKWDDILQLFPKNRTARQYLILCDLKLHPGSKEIMMKRQLEQAKLYIKNKDLKSAERVLTIMKAIDARYPGIAALLARVRTKQKDAGGEQLTAGDRAEVNRRYRTGMGLYQAGGKNNIEKALAIFRWVVRKNPNNIKAVIITNKIEAQLRLGQAGGERKKRLTPRQQLLVNKYYYSGINYYSNNNFRKAIQQWQRVLAIDPGNIKARNNIRKVMVFLGR